MSRTPTTTDTTVEWQERVTDPDSDSLTISLVLDAVDDGTGFTNDGTDSSNLSWLSFNKTKNTLNDGTLEVLVDITANKNGLQQGYTYRFKVTADDGTTAVDRTFTLSIKLPPSYKNSKRLYYVDGSDVVIRELHADNVFDETTLTEDYELSYGKGSSPRGFYISPDGKHMYVGDITESTVYWFEMSTAYDISTASFTNSITDSTNLDQPTAIFFKPDGKKFFANVSSGNGLSQFDLTTAWDVTTASYVSTTSIGGNDVSGIYMDETGKELVTFDANENIEHRTLGTAWDMSTVGAVKNSKSLPTLSLDGIDMNYDHTKVYGFKGGDIWRWNLNSEYELGNTTNSVSTALPGSVSTPVAMKWSGP